MHVISAVANFLCGLHNFSENWSQARDVNGRDQDVDNFCVDETERRHW